MIDYSEIIEDAKNFLLILLLALAPVMCYALHVHRDRIVASETRITQLETAAKVAKEKAEYRTELCMNQLARKK